MKAWDYINAADGAEIVFKYGALLTIVTCNAICLLSCYRSNWQDVPVGAAGLLTLIITIAGGTKLGADALARNKGKPPASQPGSTPQV